MNSLTKRNWIMPQEPNRLKNLLYLLLSVATPLFSSLITGSLLDISINKFLTHKNCSTSSPVKCTFLKVEMSELNYDFLRSTIHILIVFCAFAILFSKPFSNFQLIFAMFFILSQPSLFKDFRHLLNTLFISIENQKIMMPKLTETQRTNNIKSHPVKLFNI